MGLTLGGKKEREDCLGKGREENKTTQKRKTKA